MNRTTRAQEIIRNHTLFAVGGGIIPLPAIDVAAVTALQMNMLEELATLYSVPFSKKPYRDFIRTFASATVTSVAASALKLVPFVGTVMGAAIGGTTAGATTYSIGQVLVEQFERGGTLSDIDWDWAMREYQKQYARGERVASELREAQDIPVNGGASGPTTSTATGTADGQSREEIFAALDRLGELKDKGILTEEEFAAQKQKLFSRL